MRLWHESLISKLPRQQLLGQHREVCALRGNGWGRKHSTVDYVFRYSFIHLVVYHVKVMDEMERRGYKVDQNWYLLTYRGKNCEPLTNVMATVKEYVKVKDKNPIYPEHNDAYLQECLHNLRGKGVMIQCSELKEAANE